MTPVPEHRKFTAVYIRKPDRPFGFERGVEGPPRKATPLDKILFVRTDLGDTETSRKVLTTDPEYLDWELVGVLNGWMGSVWPWKMEKL